LPPFVLNGGNHPSEEIGMTWEYKIVYIGTESTDEDEYEKRLHDGVHMLNELGNEGWELIGYLPHQMTTKLTKHHVILKRPKGGT
jgi:hypothetical protein